jgi:hypothetical protein
MSTQFRPVDCTSKQPLNFNPGFVNQTIYGDKVETGWGWFPYKQNTVTFWSQVRPRRQGWGHNFDNSCPLSCCFIY